MSVWSRWAALPVLVSLAVLLAVGAPGWGCVPQPLISLEPRSFGPPGSVTEVRGLSLNGTAEIRWNAADGPKLGIASGPTFSVPITIPQAPEGLYAILVFERNSDGSVGSSGKAAFLVTGSGTEPGQGSTTTISTRTSSRSSSGADIAAVGGVGLVVIAGGFAGACFWHRRRHGTAVREES